MINADLFKKIFGRYATDIWALPEKDFLEWLSSEADPCEDIITKAQAKYAISNAEVHFGIESDIDFSQHMKEVHAIINGVLDAQKGALDNIPTLDLDKTEEE